MRRPTCTLCQRVRSHCIFPTKRKRPSRSGKTNRCVRLQHSGSGAYAPITVASSSFQCQASKNQRLTVCSFTEELPTAARGTLQPTAVSHTAVTIISGVDSTNAGAEPAMAMRDHAAQTNTSGLADNAGESVALTPAHDPRASVHGVDMFTFQEGFSPSLSEIFLQDGISDQIFWHPSDRFPSPEIHRTNSSYSQRLDNDAASLQPTVLVTGTCVTSAVPSLNKGLGNKLYALKVPESLVKELSVFCVSFIASIDLMQS